MDFGILENLTTWQDVKDLTDQNDIEEFKSMYNDRTCSYFLRSKSRNDIIDIMDEAEVAAMNTDFILINRPPQTEGGFFGTHLICDPDKWSDIETALWAYDNTMLEPNHGLEWWATKARLEAG